MLLCFSAVGEPYLFKNVGELSLLKDKAEGVRCFSTRKEQRRRRSLISAQGWSLRQPWETKPEAGSNAESVGEPALIANAFSVSSFLFFVNPRVVPTLGYN